jgi:hypothetical protein
MTEQAPSEIIYLQKPTQCLLWEHPDRAVKHAEGSEQRGRPVDW